MGERVEGLAVEMERCASLGRSDVPIREGDNSKCTLGKVFLLSNREEQVFETHSLRYLPLVPSGTTLVHYSAVVVMEGAVSHPGVSETTHSTQKQISPHGHHFTHSLHSRIRNSTRRTLNSGTRAEFYLRPPLLGECRYLHEQCPPATPKVKTKVTTNGSSSAY